MDSFLTFWIDSSLNDVFVSFGIGLILLVLNASSMDVGARYGMFVKQGTTLEWECS